MLDAESLQQEDVLNKFSENLRYDSFNRRIEQAIITVKLPRITAITAISANTKNTENR